MASQQRVSVLLGSQRGANGNAEAVAAWFASRWPPTTEYSLDIVESVTKFSLPPLTGHLIPAAANEQYPDAAVQRWSDHVKGAAAIIIITPQYNWSIPSSLKLALDHLYPEWKAKKVGVITYGGHGGSKVAEHLKVMLPGGLKVDLVQPLVGVTLPREVIAGPTRLSATEATKTFAAYDAQADELIAALLGSLGA